MSGDWIGATLSDARLAFVRSRFRDTSLLASASVLTGLLAYAFFALSTRALGAEVAAPVSVLWTYWSFASAAFTFPLQQWVVRSVAAHGGEGAVRAALPRVSVVVLAVAAVSGVGAWWLREALFRSDSPLFPLLVAVVTLGSGFIGVVRGGLAARRRFTALAAALVAENGVRVVAALALLISDVTDPVSFGLVLASGAWVGLLWPSAFRFATGTGDGASESALGFLGGASGGQLAGQAVLTGGPVVLALTGGSPADVTILFAALALFRAPYQVALVVVARVTGGLTTRYVSGDVVAIRRWRRGLLTATLVGVPVGAALGALLGPSLLPLIFGAGVELSAGSCAVLAAGSTVALTNLMLTVMLMAQGRTWAVLRGWLVGIAAAALVLTLVDSAELTVVSWAFVVAELVACLALASSELRGVADSLVKRR